MLNYEIKNRTAKRKIFFGVINPSTFPMCNLSGGDQASSIMPAFCNKIVAEGIFLSNITFKTVILRDFSWRTYAYQLFSYVFIYLLVLKRMA